MFKKLNQSKRFKELSKQCDHIKDIAASLPNAGTPEFEKSLKDASTQKDPLVIMAHTYSAVIGVMGITPHDEQVFGALIMYDRNIAEMQTGEGKTLTAAMAAASMAISGNYVHVATVNDYLAERDCQYSKALFGALNISSAFVIANQTKADKKIGYTQQVVYATAQELGFDYLKDNLVSKAEDLAQKGFDCVIIDEADSILIDEATTPLIISGVPTDNSGLFFQLKNLAESVPLEMLSLDFESKNIEISDDGYELIEEEMIKLNIINQEQSIYDPENLFISHAITSSLAALHLYKKDVDYLLENNEILIIDANTGRAMKGRRWSTGLHQSIEAKENLAVKSEPPTLASITFQSFFSLYSSMSGLTGTASSDHEELKEVYNLDVIKIPTHLPSRRQDCLDRIFISLESKYAGIVKETKEAHEAGQPILIGTNSVSSSETISKLLEESGIPHQTINAKKHKEESVIISNAGGPGAVTIATQMAGRGTDIILGGADKDASNWQELHNKAKESGGLLVIGTEKGNSSRVDQQLRGRSGRQGDPGRSIFFLSLEDDLIATFAKEPIQKIMASTDLSKNEGVEGSILSKIIKKAQQRKESIDREARVELMRYEDINARQRNFIYSVRNRWLHLAVSDSELRQSLIDQALISGSSRMLDACLNDEGDVDSQKMQVLFATKWNVSVNQDVLRPVLDGPGRARMFLEAFTQQYYEHRKTFIHNDVLVKFETTSLLEGLDKAWAAHQQNIEIMRDGINLRSYANKDPKIEFQIEAAEMFESVFDEAYAEAANTLLGSYIPDKSLQVKAE